ncbi:hypothetical protein GOODEAATRI_031937, partial [Goodea atripinnis]
LPFPGKEKHPHSMMLLPQYFMFSYSSCGSPQLLQSYHGPLGSQPGFYQWSRGVRMRANLDLVLDWAHIAGLGELALEHTQTLSSAINLLATPRKNLLQVLTESGALDSAYRRRTQ